MTKTHPHTHTHTGYMSSGSEGSRSEHEGLRLKTGARSVSLLLLSSRLNRMSHPSFSQYVLRVSCVLGAGNSFVRMTASVDRYYKCT